MIIFLFQYSLNKNRTPPIRYSTRHSSVINRIRIMETIILDDGGVLLWSSLVCSPYKSTLIPFKIFYQLTCIQLLSMSWTNGFHFPYPSKIINKHPKSAIDVMPMGAYTSGTVITYRARRVLLVVLARHLPGQSSPSRPFRKTRCRLVGGHLHCCRLSPALHRRAALSGRRPL